MQKNGKTVMETVQAIGISDYSVRKIRAVGTWQAYLRRWVYPKRKNGQSYKQTKFEEASKNKRVPVNGREKEINDMKKENQKNMRKQAATDEEEVAITEGLRLLNKHVRRRERLRVVCNVLFVASMGTMLFDLILLAVAAIKGMCS